MVSVQGEGVYPVPAVEWMTKTIRASTRLAGDHGQWLAAVIEAMEHAVETGWVPWHSFFANTQRPFIPGAS